MWLQVKLLTGGEGRERVCHIGVGVEVGALAPVCDVDSE